MASWIRFDQQVQPRETPGKAGLRMPGAAGQLSAFQVQADLAHERSLSRLIEDEIIPRLLIAHRADVRPGSVVDGDDRISPEEVAEFAPLSLQVEADMLLAHVEMILLRGVSFDTLLVDLLAPAARLLGEYWEEDRCDFVDVTMGLWRLQEIVHELSARLPTDRRPTMCGRRALFASMPGDQHSFGTVVIDELFCREGWMTDRLAEVTAPDLIDRVRSEWFDLIGLTISCDCHIQALPTIIAALRQRSRNPRVCVMVGGRVFINDADLAAKVGADGTAANAKLAVEAAGKLVAAMEWEAAH